MIIVGFGVELRGAGCRDDGGIDPDYGDFWRVSNITCVTESHCTGLPDGRFLTWKPKTGRFSVSWPQAACFSAAGDSSSRGTDTADRRGLLCFDRFEASNSDRRLSARRRSLFVFFGRASKPDAASSARISWPIYPDAIAFDLPT